MKNGTTEARGRTEEQEALTGRTKRHLTEEEQRPRG